MNINEIKAMTLRTGTALNDLGINLFIKNFGGHQSFFVGSLKPLFWTSGDVCHGFQS